MTTTYNIDDIKITLPSIEMLNTRSLFSDNNYGYGKKSALTDFAILTGNFYEGYTEDYTLKNRTGSYYTTTYNEPANRFLKISCFGYTGIILDYKDNYPSIRPVLYLPDDLFEQVTKNKRKINDNIYEVEFGEYPQYAPSNRIQKILNKKYKTFGAFRLCGKFYTQIDSINIGEWESALIDVETGKKYVKFKANFFDSSEYSILSNNRSYNDGDEVWIEISPVVWLIDEKKKALISKRSLISGIRMDNPEHMSTNFEDTEMNKFLNTRMLRDLFQNTDLTVYKEIVKEEQEEPKEEPTEVEKIIQEIKTYLPYYHGKEDINEIINNIINEYNNNLELLKSSLKCETINLELQSEEVLYNNLIIKLNNILTKLKLHYENNKKYLDMINIINTSCHLLEKDNLAGEIDSEFIRDIKTISEVILPFLDESERNKIKKELNNILSIHSKNILNYLDSLLIFDNNNEPIKELTYHNLTEFELTLRKDIGNTLQKLSFYVNRKDVIKEITDGIKDSINGVYEESNNKLVSLYLNVINDIIDSINEKINSKEKYTYYVDKINEIVDIKLDYNLTNEEIFKILLEVYSKLYRLKTELDREIKIDKYKVKILK